jgi:hypothetical protein
LNNVIFLWTSRLEATSFCLVNTGSWLFCVLVVNVFDYYQNQSSVKMSLVSSWYRVLIGEFCTSQNAQQSVHPTGGSLRVFRQFAWLEAGSGKVVLSHPTHQRVTLTVSPFFPTD